uniref:Structure-specific endonuclease subunit SLX1 homolog n=1 Tax=Hirondellea gigas TaxID=1518452 RepID=A0A2P2I601_9CRUS
MSSNDGFYGVYLLVSENPARRGLTYIGFTVHPARRLRQHNRGSHAGGAGKTSSRGPWSMVLITHGFPNEVSALRVEWAWQHPDSSRRLKNVSRKRSTESRLQYSLRLLGCILNTTPWCALPLTVTWLDQRYYTPFPEQEPPPHIPVTFCSVDEVRKSLRGGAAENRSDQENEQQPQGQQSTRVCSLCSRSMELQDMIRCVHKGCLLVSHVVCLGQQLLTQPTRPHPATTQPPITAATKTISGSQTNAGRSTADKGSKKAKESCCATAAPLLPVEGKCPSCGGTLLWGDLVRPLSVACASSRGSNRGKGVWGGPQQETASGDNGEDFDCTEESDEYDDDHWANMLTQR